VSVTRQPSQNREHEYGPSYANREVARTVAATVILVDLLQCGQQVERHEVRLALPEPLTR
jgi:hypothetical protein